jgi:hypothetical protein
VRKKDHIHIHALLVEVTRYLIENEGLPTEALASYDALDTHPSNIHEPKRIHREASITLTSAIEPWLERRRTESPMKSVNEPQ